MHIWILYEKKGQRLYEGKVIFITSDLLERKIKLVDIIRNEFLLQWRINKMSIYEVLVVVTFVIVTIMMISQYIDSEVPKVCEVLQLMNIFPCLEIKVYKNGHRIKTSELIQHINSPVKVHELKDGILYIEIY